MNFNELLEAICADNPVFWQKTKQDITHRNLLEHFLKSALEVDATPDDAETEYVANEFHPIRFSSQVRDRAVTTIARTLFNCAKNQLKQHQQSRLEAIFKKATDSGLVRIPTRQARYKIMRTNHLPNSANIAREEAMASHWFESLHEVSLTQDSMACALYALYELLNLGYGLYPAASIILHLRRGELSLPTLCTPVHPDEPGPYIHHRIIPPALASTLQHWANRLDNDTNTRARGGKLTQRQSRSAALELQGPANGRYTKAGLERLIKCLAKAHKKWVKTVQVDCAPNELQLTSSLNQLSIFAARLRKRALTHNNLQHALYTQLESLPLPTDTANGLGDLLVDTHYHLIPLQRLPYHAAQINPAQPEQALAIASPQAGSPDSNNLEAGVDTMTTVRVTELQETCSLDELYYAEAEKYLRYCLREWEKCYGRDYLTKRDRQDFIDQLQQQMLRVQQRFGDDAGLAVALFWLGTRLLGYQNKRTKIRTAADFGRRVVGQALLTRKLPVRLLEWEAHHPRCLFDSLNTSARSAQTRRQLYQQARMFLQFAQERGRLAPELEIPTINNRYIPFKRRNEFLNERELIELCERLQLKHKRHGMLLALLHAIWFYTGIRPNELLSRTFRDIHLGNAEGYMIIQYGKSNQARRKIEFEVDLPLWVQTLLRSYLEGRLATFPKQRRQFNNVALFGPAHNENAYNAQQMTRFLIELAKLYTGKDIDLHTHRHRFITAQMLIAALPCDFDRSHLKTGVIPATNPQRQGDISEQYEYQKKQAGHLYASTSFESYCHAFGLMLCAPMLQR